MGSPAFALPTLEVLATNYNLVGVVTQPDRPAGRGRALTPPPVKEKALEKGVAVIQPRRISSPEALDQLQIWSPDLIVVAAFGQILKTAVLDLPPEGCVNVHASLLPRWRGGAPIQAAILNGDRETGVTIMQMDAGLDTGPIISQEAIPIQPEDTGGSMDSRLAQLGANLLQATLPEFLAGNLLPQPQAEDQATFAPLLAKQDGLLDFNEFRSGAYPAGTGVFPLAWDIYNLERPDPKNSGRASSPHAGRRSPEAHRRRPHDP